MQKHYKYFLFCLTFYFKFVIILLFYFTGTKHIFKLGDAGIAQLIERCLAKAEVAGLSPVSRSIILMALQPSGKARVCKTLIPGSNPGGASKAKTRKQKTFDINVFCFWFKVNSWGETSGKLFCTSFFIRLIRTI